MRKTWVQLTADPGRIRLRSAAATTLSLLVAMVAMLGFTRVTGQPITVAMLGAVAAMQSSAAVKDRDQRSRIITTLLLFFPSVGAVALAALLLPLGKIADVGFIAVLFGAVWVRRYGPRGNALGMIAFISYFFSLFLQTRLEQVPVLAVAVAVGIAASLLVRTLVFPDRPRVEALRLLAALRVASDSALDAAVYRAGGVEMLRRRLDQLGETALLIDDWLDRHEAAKSFSVTSKDLALRVFEAQIMLEQSAGLLWSLDPDTEWPTGLEEAIGALRTCLTNSPSEEQLQQARHRGASAAESADLSITAGIVTVTLYRAMQAHLAIHHITTNALDIADEGAAESEPERDADDETQEQGLHSSTKAAIQVAVATSAATILGELISPDRWYWAVLTAFLVFTGVTTRGEILSRAGHRIVGTIAGVVAGVLLAALIGQHPPVQIVVLLICVFCAFYLVAVAYVWLTFFVTVLLAMLYGLLGTFSLQVLELRVAETAAGGVVGIASAYFIFSTKTRTTFAERVRDYLDQMNDVITAAVDSVLVPGSQTDLVADTRRLDNALQDVITAGKPLQIGPPLSMRRGVRRLLRGLQISNRSAHALARAGVAASHGQPDSAPPEAIAEALRHAAARAGATVSSVREAVEGKSVDSPERDDETVASDVIGVSVIPPGPLRAAIRALNTLDRTLAEVTTRV